MHDATGVIFVSRLLSGSMSKRPPRPANPGQPSPNNAALDRAFFALRMQRPDEAERLAADVLKSDRSNVHAAQILGRALLIQNRPAEAIVPLERAARRGEDPAVASLLGGALAAAGRSSEALDQLKKTTAQWPSFVPAFLEYAGLLNNMGRFDEAVAVLESGLAVTPGAGDLRLELGLLHVKRNDRAEARAALQQVLAATPERPDAMAALATVMSLDGEYAAAADLFRHVLRLRPDDAMSRHTLAACLLEMGERDAGEASLRAGIRGAPQTAGLAITMLAGSSHGRFFLRRSDAAKFLIAEKN
jgi:tetratricopeptide (TPR) repeat protein